MPEQDFTPKQPAFHIVEPNQMHGNKVTMTLNPLMARKLCEGLESIEGIEGDKHMYALLKGIRRHYHKIKKQRAERGEEMPTTVDGSANM